MRENKNVLKYYMKYTYFLIAFILVLFLYDSFNLIEGLTVADETIIYQNQGAISDIEDQMKDIQTIVSEANDMAKQNAETIKKSQQSKEAASKKVKEAASKLPAIPQSQHDQFEATLKKYS